MRVSFSISREEISKCYRRISPPEGINCPERDERRFERIKAVVIVRLMLLLVAFDISLCVCVTTHRIGAKLP